MPRRRRNLSPIDTYHVMLRGINYQQIFEEELDYTKFLNILVIFVLFCMICWQSLILLIFPLRFNVFILILELFILSVLLFRIIRPY